ncbi:CRISPR-associated endonuclease Cas2 [bacterium]|nr:CRISPR-associated endonuclease Cas2 [bacterium]
MDFFILITYDIVLTKRRNKVAKILTGFGQRVQLSVFECFLTKEKLELLVLKLEKVIDLKKDSIRFYRMDLASYKSIKISGIGTLSENLQIILV